MEGDHAPLTVVVPTYNSGRTIGRCLASISRQTLIAKSVVVVDDVRTSDETRAIVESYGAQLIVSPAGMSESRNMGFAATDTPFLFSVDSDMVLSPKLIDALMDAFDRGAQALSIKEFGVGRGYWARGRVIDKAAVEATGHGVSLRAFSRSIFDRLGGYDDELEAGEDLDLHRRIVAAGITVEHISSAPIKHDEGNLRLMEVVRKKYRYGTSMPRFESKHGSGVLTHGWPSRLMSGIRIGAGRDPLAVPAFLILKFVEAGAGSCGRLLARRGATPNADVGKSRDDAR